MAGKTQEVVIPAPNFARATFTIVGTAPYVQNKFSKRAMRVMTETQAAGTTARGKKNRSAKDFQQLHLDARHESSDGWFGIPASSFRNAMISACRVVGFHMTKAKLSVFTEADGYDKEDGTPLAKIAKGIPHYCEHAVRNDNGGTDIRPRAMWDEGWEAQVRVRWDADQFTLADVTHLLARAGMQVGIGEGRPDSRDSAGMGWGTFDVKGAVTGTQAQ